MSDKFAWEKMKRRDHGSRAARSGMAFYCGTKAKPKRKRKKSKGVKKKVQCQTWNVLTTMPFGKHKGIPVAEVPVGYLQWVVRECKNISPYLRRSINVVVNGGYSRTKVKTKTESKEVTGEHYAPQNNNESPF